jgi:hypothetical protein
MSPALLKCSDLLVMRRLTKALFVATIVTMAAAPIAARAQTQQTCQPGQVLNGLGQSCLPSPTLPPLNSSLLPDIPADLLQIPNGVPANAATCSPGQVLQANGQACGPANG